jgi:8-oxo-dGTP diphosphatase
MDIMIVAKAVLVNDRGRVLLLRRSMTDPRRPGQQDFPGGGIDDGEELTHGVAREIREEAGLNIAPGDLRLFYAATESYDGTSVTRLLFFARAGSAAVQLSYEHDQYQWLEPEAAVRAFPHPFYGAGLQYGIEHNLLS